MCVPCLLLGELPPSPVTCLALKWQLSACCGCYPWAAGETAMRKIANPRLRSRRERRGLHRGPRVLCVFGSGVFKPLFSSHSLGEPLLSFYKSSSLACLVPEAEHASSIKLMCPVLQSLNSLNFIILGGGVW